jgi:hypothetical protein
LSSSSSWNTEINIYGKEIQKSQIIDFSFGVLFNLTTIPSYFMSGCTSFNQQLTIPDCVTSIGNYFMLGCTSFNQQLTIPDCVTSIGNNFMSGCTSYNNLIYCPGNTSRPTHWITESSFNGCIEPNYNTNWRSVNIKWNELPPLAFKLINIIIIPNIK